MPSGTLYQLIHLYLIKRTHNNWLLCKSPLAFLLNFQSFLGLDIVSLFWIIQPGAIFQREKWLLYYSLFCGEVPARATSPYPTQPPACTTSVQEPPSAPRTAHKPLAHPIVVPYSFWPLPKYKGFCITGWIVWPFWGVIEQKTLRTGDLALFC